MEEEEGSWASSDAEEAEPPEEDEEDDDEALGEAREENEEAEDELEEANSDMDDAEAVEEEEGRDSDSPVSSLASQLNHMAPAETEEEVSEDSGSRPLEPRPPVILCRKKESPWARLRQNSEAGSDASSSPSTSGLPFFMDSPFPYVPPTVRFALPSQKVRKPKRSVLKLLRWCHNSLIPKVVRRCLLNSHFEIVHERTLWIGYWGKHLKTANFHSVLPYQKAGNLKYGFSEEAIKLRFESGKDCSYIVDPFLINGSKFDLRLYVYITSFNPLRLYLNEDGLVRFASLKYSSAVGTFANRFIHLTNYSINKSASNDQPNSSTTGPKWAVRDLWRYFSEEGHDVRAIMESIVDLVIKSVISCECNVCPVIKANTAYPFACHELFGFDILLDSNLKPWLLECNISPSLHSSTGLDCEVKTPLARDVLNLAGITIPHKSQLRMPAPGHPLPQKDWPGPEDGAWDRLDYRAKPTHHHISADQRLKQAKAVAEWEESNEVPSWVLDNLTAADVRLLVDTEAEWERRGDFTRIFPSPFSHAYLPYFQRTSYANLLLHAWIAKPPNAYIAKGPPPTVQPMTGMQLLETLCIQKKHLQ